MCGKFTAKYLKRYLFEIFVVSGIVEADTLVISKKQVGPVAEPNAFLADKNIDLPAKLK